MRKLCLLSCVLAAALPSWSAEAPARPGQGASQPEADPAKEALKAGATVAQIFLEYLKPNANTEFPGALAWVTGTGATIGGLDKDNPADTWRSLDPDRLITRNPAWWQVFYEVAPADPGLALLQAGTLICAGDTQRAIIVLRLALHHKELDVGSAKIIISVMQHAGAYMQGSHDIVREGIVLHDKGDYTGAIAKYDAALKLWPRNGWAFYEKGFSIRLLEGVKKGDPPQAVAAFARSRDVDPFQWSAWQGHVKDVPGLIEMQKDARPIWDKVMRDLNYQMSDEELAKFATTLQTARVDDLALIARQVMIHRRGRYAPEDHPFITESLRRLVPGDRTEAVLNKLAGTSFKGIRLYAPMEEDKEEKKTE